MPYQLFNEVEILVLVNIYSCACAIPNCSKEAIGLGSRIQATELITL